MSIKVMRYPPVTAITMKQAASVRIFEHHLPAGNPEITTAVPSVGFMGAIETALDKLNIPSSRRFSETLAQTRPSPSRKTSDCREAQKKRRICRTSRIQRAFCVSLSSVS
jgi:ferredoxin-NADP reductase